MTNKEFVIRLQEICRKYDECYGPYPESMFQELLVFSDIIAHLGELLNEHDGWDGHHGKLLRPEIAYYVFNLLLSILTKSVPVPHLMLMSDGGLQIEWHKKGWDIEISISSLSSVTIYIYSKTQQYEDTYHVPADDFQSFRALTAHISN